MVLLLQNTGSGSHLMTLRGHSVIPEQTIGRFKTEKKYGILHLYEDDFEWMQLCKGELARHQEAIDACSRDVIIAGLGLGYVVEQLNNKPEVTSIVVVEIAPEVIELVWPYFDHDKAEIVNDDIFNYLRNTDRKFDYACFDVHRDISFEQYETIVKPLRELAEKTIEPDRIFQWREHEMERKRRSKN